MASTPVKVTAAQENANGYLRDLHLVAVVGPDGTPISGGGGGSGDGVTTLQPGVDLWFNEFGPASEGVGWKVKPDQTFSFVTSNALTVWAGVADKPFRVTEVLAP